MLLPRPTADLSPRLSTDWTVFKTAVPPGPRSVAAMFLTALLVACNPKAGSPTEPSSSQNQAQVATQTESSSACEKQLRQELLSHDFKFQAAAGFDESVTTANQILKAVDSDRYLLNQVRGQTTALSLLSLHQGPQQESSATATVSVATPNSDVLFNLDLSVTNLLPDSRLEVSQSFQIDARCRQKLTKTATARLEKTSELHYRNATQILYNSGESAHDEVNFSIQTGQKLANLAPKSNDLDGFAANSVSFDPGFGLDEVLVLPQPKVDLQKFGLALHLEHFEVTASQKGKPVLTLHFFRDRNARVKYSENGVSTQWEVPVSVWSQQTLLGTGNLNQNVQVNWPDKYLQQNNRIHLHLAEGGLYEHFSAYWIKAPESPITEQRTDFQLVENSFAQMAGPVAAEDLESNSTIQVDLPEIRTLAEQIRASAPANRQQQAQGILDYLSKHYKFDSDMIKNNIIRPLTTQEAFNRGQGVCQHYSVLFTALARALQIPTRIVVGYLLSTDEPAAGAHAWVEAQLEPGVWKVIEPQNPNSLKQMDIRRYLPVSRADNLENKDLIQPQMGLALMKFIAELSPGAVQKIATQSSP